MMNRNRLLPLLLLLALAAATRARGYSSDASYQLHEYACHEGNYGLANILRASRAADAGGSK
jgi:hypothetical protein